MQRSQTSQNVAWFLDLIERGQMELNPKYQRKSVWTKPYRRFFLDTVMRGYPAPPILLNQEIGTDGKNKYYVIDGKQRLESLVMFKENKIALAEDFGNEDLNGKYFNDIPEDKRTVFWSYGMSVEIFNNADEILIKESFDRINRNVLKLTAQELRHSKFSGRFISFVTNEADDPFWKDNDISRIITARRMKDIEFISELFLLTMHGPETSSKDMLDKYYADYDEEIPNEKENRNKITKLKDMILNLNIDIAGTRFRNFTDFYSLWGAMLNFLDKEIDYEETRKNMIAFLNKLEGLTEESKNQESDPFDYYLATKSQPNVAVKRKARITIISKLIVVK